MLSNKLTVSRQLRSALRGQGYVSIGMPKGHWTCSNFVVHSLPAWSNAVHVTQRPGIASSPLLRAGSCRGGHTTASAAVSSHGSSSNSTKSLLPAMAAAAMAAAAAAAAFGAGEAQAKEQKGSGGAGKGGTPEAVETGRPPGRNKRENSAASMARQNTKRKQRSHYPYIIVGAGTTAHAAIEGILQEDPNADILMVTDEATIPRQSDVYTQERPPEAMDLYESYNEWRRHASARLDSEPDAFSQYPMTLLLGKKRVRLDTERRALQLDDGQEIFFDKCLIATAGKPRQFYVLDYEKSRYFLRDRINTLSSIADFESLHHIKEELDVKHVTVVGGGFLGTEVALAMARRGMKVAQVYAESAPLQRHLPIYLAEFVGRELQSKGVESVGEKLVTDVRCGEQEEDVEKIHLTMMSWEKTQLTTDYVILASTHIDPVVTIAKASGMEIDPSNGGIVVNGQMEAIGGIYASGACASFHDRSLGRRRVDMFDHSLNSGLLAGRNMAVSTSTNPLATIDKETESRRRVGSLYPRLYTHQPKFQSKLSDLGILVEGLGDLDSRMRTVGVWVEGGTQPKEASPTAPDMATYNRGVVYYLNGTHIAGILLWNASDLVEKARDVLSMQPTISSTSALKTLVALAPEDWLRIVETSSATDTNNYFVS